MTDLQTSNDLTYCLDLGKPACRRRRSGSHSGRRAGAGDGLVLTGRLVVIKVDIVFVAASITVLGHMTRKSFVVLVHAHATESMVRGPALDFAEAVFALAFVAVDAEELGDGDGGALDADEVLSGGGSESSELDVVDSVFSKGDAGLACSALVTGKS